MTSYDGMTALRGEGGGEVLPRRAPSNKTDPIDHPCGDPCFRPREGNRCEGGEAGRGTVGTDAVAVPRAGGERKGNCSHHSHCA